MVAGGLGARGGALVVRVGGCGGGVRRRRCGDDCLCRFVGGGAGFMGCGFGETGVWLRAGVN